ncbi:MAG: 23S rRNA (guanosine(2251)-2'-O)-methyltransferase RlmB [Desulfobulbaceae bacterium]|nr:23S rRNA (guanosine(2251)-2'-O)-methyltransferase RlmB [Desulfobulbaceae bacterium]
MTIADQLIWGIHAVLEQLHSQPRQVRDITVQQGKGSVKLQEIIDLARQHNLRLRFEPRLKPPSELGPINHQGVIARVQSVPTVVLEDLLAGLADRQDPPVLLALDSIQDPHNLGAIIRSAVAAGVAGILLPKDRSAPLSGTVAKVAVGALAHLPICMITNLATALQQLKENGFWIYGTAGEAAHSIYQTDFAGKVCLVVGGEGKGMRPLVREQCDHLVAIPMHGPVESLNASVATAVVLFEMVRQREAARAAKP